MGYYNNGKFNLNVSIRYIPSDQELDFLCQMFQQVSKIIYDSTDAQQSIGYIQIATDSMGGEDADIWLHPNDDVWPNSTSARLWFPGESLDISQDFTYFATILAHELSHYLYDLRDEYNNGSVCQGNIATEASMMEGYDWNLNTRWTDAAGNDYATFAAFFADFVAGTAVFHAGHPSEFCHAGNHDATANNNQNNINNNQSCWQWMGNNSNHGNIPYNLVIPGAGGPSMAEPSPDPAASICVELIPAQRYMLVLDHSYSMVGSKISQLIAGAHFWVDYVHSTEELGLVKFSSAANLISPMSEVPASAANQATWRDSRHTIVDTISATAATAIGDGLRIGLTNLLDAGSAAAQVIILFTDGLQNVGTETAEDVLPDAVAAGVKIYTIGLGADQDVALLTNIATTTGGLYFGIPADVDAADAADAVSDALAHVSGHSRSNSAVKSFEEVDGSSVGKTFKPDPNYVAYTWPDKLTVKDTPSTAPAARSFRFPVEITEGSSGCTLGVKWYNASLSFRIKVTDPSGNTVNPGAGARLVSGKHPYSFYEIDNPQAGIWYVEVFGNIRNSKFRTIGFEVHKNIRFEVNAKRYHIKAGELVELRAKLMYLYALPGVSLTATVRHPSGKIQSIKFYENKGSKTDKEEENVYTASYKTAKSEQGQYIISVTASYKGKEFTFKPDELYTKKPGRKNVQAKIKVPRIQRKKVLCIIADRMGPCQCDEKDIMIHGFNNKDVSVNPKQREYLKRWKENHNK